MDMKHAQQVSAWEITRNHYVSLPVKMADYESILCVKNQVHVYKIPPRATNRGYRCEIIYSYN